MARQRRVNRTAISINIRGSSNGRTTDSESVYRGSNPCPRAIWDEQSQKLCFSLYSRAFL